jgi:formylmethanofuran dehydrogenase subunit E
VYCSKCTQCGREFSKNSNVVVNGNRLSCHKCFEAETLDKCAKCQEVITDATKLKALGTALSLSVVKGEM